MKKVTAMDFLPSDLEHMNTNFLDMIESEVNSHLLDIDSLNTDKLHDILNGEMINDNHMEQENDDSSDWLSGLQGWGDMSKIPQSLIDASNEVENNNPNLLVNPQSVLPMQATPQIQPSQTQQHHGQLHARQGIAVKINGQDAVLTPTQHPQIQYVTVQNVTPLTSAQIGYTVQPITICPQQLQQVASVASPSLTSPVLVEHLQNGTQTTHVKSHTKSKSKLQPNGKVYPKPVYSYSCLIALALKNSRTGNLPVSEIYNFMTDNFPYFKTAPDGWKNSVRHNLSLNKCFAKVDTGKPTGTHTRKGCLWGLNPAKIEKMEEEIVKWRKKDPESVILSMSKPENLELIEQGKAGLPHEEPSSPVESEPSTPIKSHNSVGTQSHRQSVKQEPLSPKKTHNIVSRHVGATTIFKQDPTTPTKAVGYPHILRGNIVKIEPICLPEMEDMEEGALDFTGCDPEVFEQMHYLQSRSHTFDRDVETVCTNNTQVVTTCTPLMSPPYGGKSQYHRTVTYTCTSPNQTQNITPTKLFTTSPTKIYPQTPSKLVLA